MNTRILTSWLRSRLNRVKLLKAIFIPTWSALESFDSPLPLFGRHSSSDSWHPHTNTATLQLLGPRAPTIENKNEKYIILKTEIEMKYKHYSLTKFRRNFFIKKLKENSLRWYSSGEFMGLKRER